jgi:hypothetical protein
MKRQWKNITRRNRRIQGYRNNEDIVIVLIRLWVAKSELFYKFFCEGWITETHNVSECTFILYCILRLSKLNPSLSESHLSGAPFGVFSCKRFFFREKNFTAVIVTVTHIKFTKKTKPAILKSSPAILKYSPAIPNYSTGNSELFAL